MPREPRKRRGSRTAIGRRLPKLQEINRWWVFVHLASDDDMTAADVAAAASAAFNRRFSVCADDLDPVSAAEFAAKEHGPRVVGETPHFYCAIPPYCFELYHVDDLLCVLYSPSSTYYEELENGYRWTARLASGFVTGGPATVTVGDREYSANDCTKLIRAMRSRDPLAALEPYAT